MKHITMVKQYLFHDSSGIQLDVSTTFWCNAPAVNSKSETAFLLTEKLNFREATFHPRFGMGYQEVKLATYTPPA